MMITSFVKGWFVANCIWLMMLLQSSSCSDLDLWQEYCPYSDFCTRKSLLKQDVLDNKQQPCCPNCSCEEDCWLFRDCCPDVPHERQLHLRQASCDVLFVKNNYSLNYIEYKTQYLVIDFCPNENIDSNEFVRDQCLERFSEGTELSDVVVVSDAKRRIYKNKYCAVCHGIVDVVSWKLRLTCDPKTISRMEYSNFMSTLLRECLLESVPPHDELDSLVYTRLCGDSLDRCRSENSNSPRSVQINDICANGPFLPYLDEGMLGRTLIFKNVFCRFCSGDDNQKHTCKVSEESTARSLISSFSLMLDMDIGEKVSSRDNQVDQCGKSETYDHIKRRCVSLFCPVFEIVAFGRCISMGTAASSYTVLVIIMYEPKEGRFISGDIRHYNEKAEDDFGKETMRKHGFDRCTLNSFDVKVFLKRSTKMIERVQYRILITLDEKCQQRDVGYIVRRQFSGYIDTSITINGLKVDLTGKLTYFREIIEETGSLFDTQLYLRNWIVHVPRTFQPQMFAHSGFILCPYLLLNISQYNLLMHEVFGAENGKSISTITQFTRVADGFYTMTEDSVAVCVDTYFALYNKNGQQPTVSGSSVQFSLVMATYMYILAQI